MDDENALVLDQQTEGQPQEGEAGQEVPIDLGALFNEAGKGDAQAQAAPDEPDADEQQAAPTFDDTTEVDLSDGRKVSLKDLKGSFETFTRKTQELAHERRAAVSSARDAVAKVAENYARQYDAIAQNVMQLVVPGVDESTLARLSIEDPAQYHAVRARMDMAQRLQHNLAQHAAQLGQQAQQQRDSAAKEAAEARQQLLSAEDAKLRHHKWYTPENVREMVGYAVKQGIPRDVAESVPFAGFVEITRKAMLYDAAMTRTKSGKQLPAQPKLHPSATAANGRAQDAKQMQGLLSRARSGQDPAAVGRLLNKIIPSG